MLNVDNLIIQKDIIEKVIEHKKYNDVIEEYYNYLACDDEFIESFIINNNLNVNIDRCSNTIENRANSIYFCNKYWALDRYEEQKIKNLLSQNLCKDKFCSNCKKVKQSARMSKYNDELKQYSNRLYHLTLTIPNVSGDVLKESIKHMAKCFKYLIQYLRGEKKIKDIDFTSFGYEGAVRSLEVTFKRDSYHPHYHVALVFNDDVLSNKNIKNKYSYNFYTESGIPELTRLFSKEEILIQKIWYLLVNCIRVNKENIENLEIGYSCSMDKFKEENYSELFKYMTKGTDDEGLLLSYDNFKSLYNGLYRVKQIQGYGCLYMIKDDINLEEYEEMYKEYIESLGQKEKPSVVNETPESLLLDDRYKLISRKSYFKHLRDTLFSD